ncbi:MAG TPA: hypothetical protein VFA10_27200 [Ktedonobacteraceae bacterium]|nr:hypothetical protein [Ktedonobacteraceae bacterium]
MQQSIFKRYMGSHALIGFTLLADVAGAFLSFLIGKYYFPLLWYVLTVIWTFLRWIIGIGAAFITHVFGSFHVDLIFYLCLVAGTFLGLVLALVITEQTSKYSYFSWDDWWHGVFIFVITLLAAALVWAIIEIATHWTPLGPALSLPKPYIEPSILTGWLWLVYYALVRLLALSANTFYTPAGQLAPAQVPPAPQQRAHNVSTPPTPKGELPQRESLEALSWRELEALSWREKVVSSNPRETRQLPPQSEEAPYAQPRENLASLPLSRAHPQGPSQERIQRCFERYRKALVRFSPPPIESLATPEELRILEGTSTPIMWEGQVLIVPEFLLEPGNEGRLLPELARQLMYYNAFDLHIQPFLNSYPREAGASAGFLFTGNALIVPATVQFLARARWEGERILDADWFAFILGEGIRLRHWLWLEREQNRRDGVVEAGFPTLRERIDQLDALINDELHQMAALGIPLSSDQQALWLRMGRQLPQLQTPLSQMNP